MEDNNNVIDAGAFWKRVQLLCRQKGIYQKQLSETLGYGLRNLDLKISRGSVPSVQELKKLAVYLNVSYEYLMDGKENPRNPAYCVPVINNSVVAAKAETSRYVPVPDGMRIYGDKVAALYISGDSMEPMLRRGDMVICDTCGYEGEGVYVIKKGSEHCVRRVYKDMGKYIIKSDNPLYPQLTEPLESASITVIGRVHYTIKKID